MPQLTVITCVQYWCWISHAYPEAYRTAGENSWLWLAFGVSLLYIPLAFFAYGYITKPTNNNWWIYHIHWKRQAIDPMQSSIAITMVMCVHQYSIFSLVADRTQLRTSLLYPSLTDEPGSLVSYHPRRRQASRNTCCSV
jgi:hypothetical protein